MPAFILDRVTTEQSMVVLAGRSEQVLVAAVPKGFFLNTARPVLGRTFTDEDYGRPPTVCILSYRLWESLGAGESDAPLIMGADHLEVIGVLPEQFDIPTGADVWIPLVPPPP